MVTEGLDRVVTMLPKTTLKKLDKAADAEGVSRSGLIRQIVIRYVRDRDAGK
jgi:metal-responsive CopG/Arc/MetJ family transcriptional regulator